QVKALRQVEVQLHGGHLPGTANGVASLDGDLRPVEGCTRRVRNKIQAGLLSDPLQNLGGTLPDLVGADELLRVLRRQLQVEVVQTVVAQQGDDELQYRGQLILELILGAVDVCVVLGETACAGQAVHHAGLLVAVDGAEFDASPGQPTIASAAGSDDEVVHRAVHRLGVVEIGRVACRESEEGG